MIDPAKLESFFDERLAMMSKRPLMFGCIEALEGECHLMIEMYVHFCFSDGEKKFLAPPWEGTTKTLMGDFQVFRSKQMPRCPSPMILSQWLTDPEWGCKLQYTPHEAAQKLIEFFIKWKTDLKTRLKDD
jgi:hypothetical protein